MKHEELTDLEKQKLLAILDLNRVCAPGLAELTIRIAESIAGGRERGSALLSVSFYLARCGNVALADAVARGRLEGYDQTRALAHIGFELAASDPNRSASYLKEAEDRLRSSGDDSDDRGVLLQEISHGYLRLKNWRKTLDFARQVFPRSEAVHTLCEIASCLWNSGKAEEAKATLVEAQEMTKEVEFDEKTACLNDVAKALVHMRRRDEAVEVLEEALAFASHSIEEGKWLLIICTTFVSLGLKDRAKEVALSIRNDARRRQALAFVIGSA